ncbi:hypothetical protein VM1G_03826 [Cytospora mali]|uniref:S1-like domain-containing protein n=1 Tax=Cytospora mali TaxID=578113 RepID=A0A194VWT1_CYTMA|nr:hypothetical protein VM1G_03826 [Valsa mali]
MGRPKRNILAAAEESTTPPDELTEYQSVVRVIKPEGNNLYSCTLPNTKTVLVELAQRFRNTIWIKRRGFVVVDLTPSEERSKANSKVDGEIINVVRDEKEWRKMPYWYVELSVGAFAPVSENWAFVPWAFSPFGGFVQFRSTLANPLLDRPKEFPKNTYGDDDEDSRALPPTDSDDEA